MGKCTQAVESHLIREPAQPGAAPGPGIGAGHVKNSLALAPYIRYNAAHLRLSEQPEASRLRGRPRCLPRRHNSGCKRLENRFSPEICAIMRSTFRFAGEPRGVSYQVAVSQWVAQAFQPVQAQAKACGYTK